MERSECSTTKGNMTMRRRRKNGLSTEVILGGAVVAAIGYYMWKQQAASTPNTILGTSAGTDPNATTTGVGL